MDKKNDAVNASSTTRNEELYPTPVYRFTVATSISIFYYDTTGVFFSRPIGIN
jgi:hypothetical protein